MKKWIATLAVFFHLSAAEDLGELFRQYGSDKDNNGYTTVYHTLFHHLSDQPIRLLEIGIGTMIPDAPSTMVGYAKENYKPGGSLRAWRDYFVKGTIYGIDIQPDTQFSEPRITTALCNSTVSTSVKEWMDKLGDVKFDIIVDDGSHFDIDQLKSLLNFYPYLKEGGIYVIEDIYPGSALSKRPGAISLCCQGDPYFFVGLTSNACVIFKKHLNRNALTANY